MLAMRNLLRDLKSNLLISIFPVNPLKEMTAVYFPARALISARNSLDRAGFSV
jgi:hypothetical protein